MCVYVCVHTFKIISTWIEGEGVELFSMLMFCDQTAGTITSRQSGVDTFVPVAFKTLKCDLS